MNSGWPQPSQQPAPTETTVKTYKSSKEFQKDQKSMAKQGWNVMNTMEHSKHSLLFRPKPEIVVTYQRVVQLTKSLK